MQKVTKHLLAFLLLCMTIGLSAAPITREQARLRAIEFLKKAPGSRQLSPVKNLAKLSPRRKASAQSQTELYYVFNRGQNEGFVIVSGDDQTRAVLGYTEEGEFDYNQLPENMRFWLQGYEEELAFLSENPLTEKPMYAPTHDKIEPMVTTKWNQGDPYNQECPIYTDKKRCITGCVATAMAQVLYYQRAKSVTEIQADIPAYTSGGGDNFHVDGIPAGSPIDWDNMLNTYGSGATAKQKLAVAQLMHYCGVAVKMMYTSSSSGAYSSNVADALPKYFGYGSSVRYVTKSNGYNDDTWDALLYKELEEGRPFYLSGSNSDGGHAFVGDGYDGNGCFHINWGWGGSSDGYYLLTKLNPGSQGLGGSSGGYSDWPEAVIGIEPENYAEKAMPISNATVKKLCLESFDANEDGVFTFGEAAALTSLGTVFKGQGITAFEELYNFTGLTSIDDDAFSGCTRLTTVKLPKRLKHIGARAFENCRTLKTLTLPEGLTSIGEGAFTGCRVLPNLVLPMGLARIEDHTFDGCLAFTSVELPLGIQHLGEQAFANCTKLTTVTVKSVSPQEITLGADVFAGIDLSAATLNTTQGTREYFRTADQWKEFGNLYEERNLSQGNFATLETNKKFYLYNVGTGYFLTRGEAWGTQAIVADTDEPMRYELRKTAAMPDGTYYLYTDDAGNADRHYLFRTNTDGKVGNGVKACFVDGASLTASTCYWRILPVEGQTNVYTIQTPSTATGYNAKQYLGVQLDHASNAAAPTYGIYSDIVYDDYTRNCQWMLVTYDESATETYKVALQLKNLLDIGKSKRIDEVNEQAVYDNFDSSIDELEKAMRSLRRKLNFINFVDAAARPVFISANDTDGNGELSYTEAAAASSIDTEFYGNTSIVDLTDLRYFTGAKYLSGNSFKDCTKLRTIIVPKSVTDIYYRAFMNDTKLETVELPQYLSSIGDDAFNGCKSLKEVRISVANPANIDLGDNLFSGVNLANAVLYVPRGSKELYAADDVWKEFGAIKEMRAIATPKFAKPEVNTDYYVYNLGMQKSITKGEAYGTQAVVDLNGFAYQLRRNNNMAEGLYYLYAEGSGTTNHVLFRTSTDSKVGEGVKTCFVDGTLSAKAYWNLQEVEGLENVYTLSLPTTDADYVEGEFLGTDYYHSTDYAYGTRGLYWDISNATDPQNTQWGFISVDEVKQAQAFFDLTEQLKELLVIADAQSIDDAAEHAVYDNFDSSEEQIASAIQSLRGKLHYIEFLDARAKTLSVNRWDDNEDGEISLEEARAVTDLGTVFRTASAMKSFDELQYFTSLTTIPDEAFRSCTGLVSIYLPAGVTSIGKNAFASNTALKYMAVLNPANMLDASESGLTSKPTVFVPKALVDTYSADETWGKGEIKEFTGTPVVAAEPASRIYGRSNSSMTYVVTGAPINGVPTLASEAETTSPIGDYPIIIEAGTITTPNVQFVNGVLTVERAPLTLTARSYSRNIGEENPTFDFANTSLKNREKIADVLLVQPTLECDATPESPAGIYEIRIYGAETANYEITYVNGTLTVIDPVGVRGVDADDQAERIYDLSGRRVEKAKRGVYIVNGRKVVK
ncbi:MAG: leucine-rich repeat protein [Bacteroidaceae bacterium]|nr:leucine-rich repeat protein [Bacteroidaceae bacterium]